MSSRFMSGLFAILLASTAGAQEPEIMSVSEIREGMVGHGVTVFRGVEPQTYDFVVRGVVNEFNGWPEAILVKLSGGPPNADGQPVFRSGLIFHGMSGSPHYVDGKLIGALATGKDFVTTAKVVITPIELMHEMGLILKGRRGTPSHIHPGGSIEVCFVYGDFDRCIAGTATDRLDGLLYSIGHPISGLKYGTHELPVFEVAITDLFEAQTRAQKLMGKRGRPVGTAAVHGKYGVVIVEGEMPRTVPVTLTIDDVYERPKTVSVNMAYATNATGFIRSGFMELLDSLPVDAKGTRLEAVITFGDGRASVRLVDTHKATLLSLESLLDALLVQEKETLDIERIDLTYSVLEVNDIWIPMNIRTDGKKDVRVTVLAKRDRDNEVMEFTLKEVFRPIYSYWKKRKDWIWLDGTNLQNRLIKALPIDEVLPYLEHIEEREALYLVYFESQDDLGKRTGRAKVDGAIKRTPRVKILFSSDLGGYRWYMGDAGKAIEFAKD